MPTPAQNSHQQRTHLDNAEDALRRGDATPRQLRYALRERYGVALPRVAVCPGHTAPMDAFWRSWAGIDRKTIWLANRGGGKTNGLGFLESMEAEYKALGIGHVAATLDQGSRMQAYASQYFQAKPDLGVGDIKQKVKLPNGGLIEILPATMAGVNGPHPVKVSLDELDLMKWSVIQQAMSMPLSRGDNLSALRIASTRKFAAGPMQKVLDEATERGFSVYTWCIFETMERCQRSSCDGCKTKVSHDRLGKPHSFADVCGGKAKRSDGFIQLGDVLEAFTGMDWEVFDAEWLCNRVESVGQYYAHYQAHIHEIGAHNTSWRPSKQYGCVLGIDEGVADPNAMVVLQPAGPASDPWSTMIAVDSIQDGDGDTLIESWPGFMALAAKYGPIVDIWGDPSGNARQNVKGGHSPYRQVKKATGQRIRTSPRFNSYKRRHDAIENRLRVRSDGEPRIYVWIDTNGGKRLSKSLQALRRPLRDGIPYGEEFVHDEHSHRCTALEYSTVGVDVIGGHAPC